MNTEQLKTVGDAVSLGTVLGALTGWLPAVAALFTIVWTFIRIIETDTVKKLIVAARKLLGMDAV